ncbi:MAG: YbjN domain-containing protein [Cyanobacteria bacterium P01_G01_bin.39]
MINPISNFFRQQLTKKTPVTWNFISDEPLSTKKSLRDLVIEYFQREDWQFTTTQDPSILSLICQGGICHWYCYAKIAAKKNQFTFYSVSPCLATPEKLFAIAEYIARANYGMVVGNFDLDFTDGEIRYKTSFDFQFMQPNIEAIAQLVYTNVSTMERYLPGILAIIEQNVDPKQAIKEVES